MDPPFELIEHSEFLGIRTMKGMGHHLGCAYDQLLLRWAEPVLVVGEIQDERIECDLRFFPTFNLNVELELGDIGPVRTIMVQGRLLRYQLLRYHASHSGSLLRMDATVHSGDGIEQSPELSIEFPLVHA